MARWNEEESVMDDCKTRLTDFFSPAELIEYLVEGGFIEYDYLVEILMPEVGLEALYALEELMGVSNGRD